MICSGYDGQEDCDVSDYSNFKISAKVLVVDDEEGMLMLYTDCLQDIGCEVATASNGDEAIDQFSGAYNSPQPFSQIGRAHV